MPSLLHGQAEAGRHRWAGRALPAPLRGTQGRQEALNRDALLQTKLSALVRDRWSVVDALVRVPFGAAIVRGHEGWVLHDGAISVGGVLGWATRAGVDVLHLIGDRAGGDTLRQVGHFAIDADVWRSEGAATSAVAEAAPAPTWPPVDDELMALAPRLRAAGADAVVVDGVLRAEVLGLEVARVTRDDDGRPRIEIGVGRNDRAAHALLGTTDLAGVVRQVRAQRSADGPSSPATQLAPDRWLRAVVMTAWDLEPMPSSLAAARGEGVVVVCSVGVDPELVPNAADVRGNERLLLVVPEGDDLPVTRRLAALLRDPAEVRTVTRDWRRSLG